MTFRIHGLPTDSPALPMTQWLEPYVHHEDPEGRVLWSARYPGQVDVTGAESHMTQDALYRHAIEQIAIELAGALPPRDTSPGRD